MPTLATFGDGVTTTFRLPVHNQQATATVGGSSVTIASQGPSHITLAVAPAVNALVAINYNPVFQQGAVKAPIVLAQSAVPASVTGTAVETVLATVSVPTLGSASRLRGRLYFSAAALNANSKTVNVKLNGVLIGTSVGLASNLSTVLEFDLFNRGASNSQINRAAIASPIGALAGAFTAYAIDTSAPRGLTITGALGVTTDTITLEGYTVEVLNP